MNTVNTDTDWFLSIYLHKKNQKFWEKFFDQKKVKYMMKLKHFNVQKAKEMLKDATIISEQKRDSLKWYTLIKSKTTTSKKKAQTK